jgi:hypothetical protein
MQSLSREPGLVCQSPSRIELASLCFKAAINGGRGDLQQLNRSRIADIEFAEGTQPWH